MNASLTNLTQIAEDLNNAGLKVKVTKLKAHKAPKSLRWCHITKK
jgi:hypothetical protein